MNRLETKSWVRIRPAMTFDRQSQVIASKDVAQGALQDRSLFLLVADRGMKE